MYKFMNFCNVMTKMGKKLQNYDLKKVDNFMVDMALSKMMGTQ